MISSQEFFKLDPDLQNYNRLKTLFLSQLAAAEDRCIKFCNNKYDQERHYSVSILPEVESNRYKIRHSKARVIDELDFIERVYPSSKTRLDKLIEYGVGLSEEYFKLLFMTVFTGKLAKHWVPTAKAVVGATEENCSNTAPSLT